MTIKNETICLWDHKKDLENRFLGTFKSRDSVGYDIYFIFLKLCVFEKTGQQNHRIPLQKGPKMPFCGCFGPYVFKLVKGFCHGGLFSCQGEDPPDNSSDFFMFGL